MKDRDYHHVHTVLNEEDAIREVLNPYCAHHISDATMPSWLSKRTGERSTDCRPEAWSQGLALTEIPTNSRDEVCLRGPTHDEPTHRSARADGVE
jgi:hypothetical protein